MLGHRWILCDDTPLSKCHWLEHQENIALTLLPDLLWLTYYDTMCGQKVVIDCVRLTLISHEIASNRPSPTPKCGAH